MNDPVPILKEHVDKEVAPRGVIEEYKQAPVDEPCPLLKLKNRRAKVTSVDRFSQGVEISEGNLPVTHQNFCGELAPQSREVAIRVRAQRTVVIQIACASVVVTAVKLEIGIAIERL